jgi:hypothetical protein
MRISRIIFEALLYLLHSARKAITRLQGLLYGKNLPLWFAINDVNKRRIKSVGNRQGVSRANELRISLKRHCVSCK